MPTTFPSSLEHLQDEVVTCTRHTERLLDQQLDIDHNIVPFLGWFSIGLGLAEVLAPHQVARLTGVGNHSQVLPYFGVREIVSGIGILTSPRPSAWLWSRVAGDLMDLTFLGLAAGHHASRPNRLAVAAAAVAGVMALDVLASDHESRR